MRRVLWPSLAIVFFLTLGSFQAPAQDSTEHRGRKYKSPPPTSRVEVEVTKKVNGKPIMNAAVVFDSKMGGKDEGNLEVKTDPDGKAAIDIIPTGSTVRVQVIANGFATFAQEYVVDGPSKSIAVAMIPPQAQVSGYVDNQGKPSTMKPGVQEPIRPTPPPPPPATTPPAPQ